MALSPLAIIVPTFIFFCFSEVAEVDKYQKKCRHIVQFIFIAYPVFHLPPSFRIWLTEIIRSSCVDIPDRVVLVRRIFTCTIGRCMIASPMRPVIGVSDATRKIHVIRRTMIAVVFVITGSVSATATVIISTATTSITFSPSAF